MKTCNVKESENPESIPLSGLAPIVSNSLFWADTHPPFKFCGNPSDKPTSQPASQQQTNI